MKLVIFSEFRFFFLHVDLLSLSQLCFYEFQNSKDNFAASQTGSGLGSRRSNGTQSQRRLPSIKRPIAASVSMQGWLHKQGSEGFMLWRKRWFVLSEYCLYYYKSKWSTSIW